MCTQVEEAARLMHEAEARLQAADEREHKVRGLTDKPTFSHTF
jgi:hypothetical protein